MKMKIALLACAAALLSTSVMAMRRSGGSDAPTARAASFSTMGNAAQGKQAFVAMGCYQCHGYVGQGGESTGPALVPQRLNEVGFVAYVRAPRGVMPAFSAKLLSADAARDILAYLHSIGPGRTAAQIPLLAHYVVADGSAPVAPAQKAGAPATGAAPSSAAGAQLFAGNCAGCHGGKLQGGIGPNLQDEGTRRSVKEIAALIAAPPPGMPKLTPEPLSPAQALQVAAFVHGPR